MTEPLPPLLLEDPLPTRRWRHVAWVGSGAVVAALIWGAWQLATPPVSIVPRVALSPAEALAGDDTVGYARALESRPFDFPEDHGSHPDFRTEWWYVTGNLESRSGRRFGVQVTFFRNAVAPELPPRASAWSTNQLWMAHVALTDVGTGRHLHGERFARGAAGLAGAVASPFRVWLEDWELRGEYGPSPFPMALRVREEGWAIDLVFDTQKPPVAQGDRGLSRKGAEEGNASYYYSFTRLPARGRVEVDGEVMEVTGFGWMDREWSTSALGEEHVGWDWFSIQLSDGYDLMLFELRREDGEVDPLNQGTLVDPWGGSTSLSGGDVQVGVLGQWQSPLDGVLYPSGWRIRVPQSGIDLEVQPLIRDQEMNLSFRYWEGAVRVQGTGVNGPVDGFGYVELTGYEPSGPGSPEVRSP